ncbi:hypothetical protein AWB75_04056 [Caballeronia catudaia]|uniref:Uncharacterized protein n=1 Tax=Caballeronia catudaia TaxID=1777136 RepID=A0A158BVN8_9BURK|nr:hypothetical protein [Caballeronia catudaia]SAK73746.1 hypothetical protein AWB75_04056 [Caballeronia catudaia]
MKKSKIIRFVFNLLVCYISASCLLSSLARAEWIRGKFLNGQTYSGEYSITETTNEDGMHASPLSLHLKLERSGSSLSYAYSADDPPSVKANDMGFLSIITNSRGMEGSVVYDYLIPADGGLITIGTVKTLLHRGKIEDIDVRPNNALTLNQVNDFVRRIIKFNSVAWVKSSNAYTGATLLLLGSGKFLSAEDSRLLSPLLENKEIVDEPVLRKALGRVGVGATDFQSRGAGDIVEALAKMPSLCVPSESIVFSCYTAARKTIALCLDKKAEPSMTYRYGRMEKIELSPPSNETDSNGFNYNHYFRPRVDYSRINFTSKVPWDVEFFLIKSHSSMRWFFDARRVCQISKR